MENKGKISDPIIMKLSHLGNEILPSGEILQSYDLTPGAVIGGDHFGFAIIVDKNDHQSHTLYKTDYKIQAAGIENGKLKIFEENKKEPWVFDLKGKLLNANVPEICYEPKNIVLENTTFFGVGMKLQNPIIIKVKKYNIEANTVEIDGKEYPLHPGALLGTENYGFIIEIDDGDSVKRVGYSTQSRIDAVGCQCHFDDIDIFEEGKYHPWKFTCQGEFISTAKYESYSRKDNEYVKQNFPFTGNDDVRKLELK